VNGAIDLKHAATLIIARIEEYEADLKAKIEKSIKAAEAEAVKVVDEVKGALS
jgi:hypothetical protein